MADFEPEALTHKYWPPILIVCGLLVLGYTLAGSDIAGAFGFLGLGWLAWVRWIKPTL